MFSGNEELRQQLAQLVARRVRRAAAERSCRSRSVESDTRLRAEFTVAKRQQHNRRLSVSHVYVCALVRAGACGRVRESRRQGAAVGFSTSTSLRHAAPCRLRRARLQVRSNTQHVLDRRNAAVVVQCATVTKRRQTEACIVTVNGGNKLWFVFAS